MISPLTEHLQTNLSMHKPAPEDPVMIVITNDADAWDRLIGALSVRMQSDWPNTTHCQYMWIPTGKNKLSKAHTALLVETAGTSVNSSEKIANF